MNPLRSYLKKLSLPVALLLTLAIVLLSAHYHSEIKTSEKNTSCSICQIAQHFTKGLQPSTSIPLAQQGFIESLSSLDLFIVYSEQPSVALIRGPPADRSV